MDIENRIKELEEEVQTTKEELQHLLLDIRNYLMSAQSPLRPEDEMGAMAAKAKKETI